ncbi:hypothetical protein N7470_008213 [Penicillium chermesinum]|nr:hypothetical protein N7470_008213 [Penicillium chermesinum]
MTTFSVTSQVPFLLLLPLLQIVPVFASTEVHVERSANSDEHRPVDKSLLAVQVGSIAGSYVIFTAVLLALLLFVGRRLRRTVHSSNYSLQMQMLKPLTGSMIMDPSPISPTAQTLPSPSQSNKFQSWGSLPRAGRPSQTSFNDSMVTVDEGVLANDRQRAQDEMEMLYAAVMEQDAQKAAGLNISSVRDSESQSPDSQYTSPFSERTASQISVAPPARATKITKALCWISTVQTFQLQVKHSFGRWEVEVTETARPQIGNFLSHGFSRYECLAFIRREPGPYVPAILHPLGPPPSAPTRAGASVGFMAPPSGRAPAPAPLSLNAAAQPLNKLPFRDAYPLQSAPATKTTILERPQNRNGPITGMPTPYSPYMPFTPVTPFTPGRTVTRKQRKREEKEAGLHVLNEDDLVKDDQDIWG